jgi:predicted ATPase
LADLGYEGFAQAEIARLEELRWDAIEARNDADLQLGRAQAVLAELERRADETPLRERLVEQHMRPLYGVGRQVEALSVYREAQRRLDAELGLQPGPALRELERAILGHDPSLASRAGAPVTLAPPPTATVGRAGELQALARVIRESRLVTLTGPGGVGKTRLALEAARALAHRFAGGVHVVYLAPVTNAVDVPSALARAVQVAVQPGERTEDALVRRLGGTDSLLVVDNAEHVLEAIALLGDLVAACAALRVLATSREPLRLRGERCVPVAPLAVSDAITLFVDRARDRRPDFGLNDANAPAVAELCRRLDGLPLALELAAGRVGLLEPEQLVARLADALPLLEGGPRDAPARQRTIRATLEWSFALLDADERHAFLALAVFVGGAELEAAEAVTDASAAILDALVAKHLVHVDGGRVTQLEVVRQFGAAGLAKLSDHDTVRRRHADYYLAVAERLGPEVRIAGHGLALKQMERELGNLRSALDHSIACRDGDRALRMVAALEPYWFATCHYREGAEAIDAALALAARAGERARGRARLARSLLQRRLNMEQSIEDADAALALARAVGDVEGQCMALDVLAYHAAYEEASRRAKAFADEERRLAEKLGDPYHVAMALMRQAWAESELEPTRELANRAAPLLRRVGSLHRIAEMLSALIMRALRDEAYGTADEAAVEALQAAEEADEQFSLMIALGNAGLTALFRGRMDVAEQRFRAELDICRRERIEGRWDEPTLGLAMIAAHAGDYERAATLLGAQNVTAVYPVADTDRLVFDRLIARFITPARSAFGESPWKRAEAAGAALTLDELYEFALEPETGYAAAGTTGDR